MAPVTGRSSPTLWCVRQSWHKPSIHYGDIRTARNVSWHLLVRMLVYPLDIVTNQASYPIDTILLQIEALGSIAVLIAQDGAFQISSLSSKPMTSRFPLLWRSQSQRHVRMFQFNVHSAPKSIGSTTSITTSGKPMYSESRVQVGLLHVYADAHDLRHLNQIHPFVTVVQIRHEDQGQVKHPLSLNMFSFLRVQFLFWSRLDKNTHQLVNYCLLLTPQMCFTNLLVVYFFGFDISSYEAFRYSRV